MNAIGKDNKLSYTNTLYSMAKYLHTYNVIYCSQ